MLKELDHLNKALIEKKNKKRGDQNRAANKRKIAVQKEEGPEQAQKSTRATKKADNDSEQ